MKISRNINIEKHNTFGIGCNAACFVEIESEKDLPDLHGNDFPKPFFCIGQGSNLLFTKDFQGTLIHFSMKGWGVVSKNDNEVIIRAEAGCVWDEFVEQTLLKGYFGLENLSLIPGTVGSSPVQNIGAYGAEASQFIETVHVFDYEEKRFFDLKNNECQFGYRNSIFKSNPSWIVFSADYRLSITPATNISYKALNDYLEKHNLDGKNPLIVRQAVMSIRNDKLPDYKVLGNAGSFFQNPVVDKNKFVELINKYPEMPFYAEKDERYKIPAAWLIDKSGWKGFTEGLAGVHHKQPLVLINLGGAKGQEIKALAEKIQMSIKNNFGIQLHPEVIYL
jgi:UDP-N-acetylmuramate dehydrogenase